MKNNSCNRCGYSLTVNGYCTNYKCSYTIWPQQVKFTDLFVLSTHEVEKKYNITKRASYNDEDKKSENFKWDDSTLIMLMEEFINSYSLEAELKAFLNRKLKEKTRS